MRRSLNDELNRRSELEAGLRFLERYDRGFGDATVLFHPQTRQKFFMRQRLFRSEERFLEELARVKRRKEIVNPHLCRLLDYSTCARVDALHQSYRLRVFYEHHETNLATEMKEMRAGHASYSNEEATYFFLQLLDALAALEQNGCAHGDVLPELVLISSGRTALLLDSFRTEELSQSQIHQYFRGQPLRFAPEVFDAIERRSAEALTRVNVHKADVFSLGLTLLELGTFARTSELYPARGEDGAPRAIRREKLQELKAIFASNYYQNPLIIRVLQKMLELDETRRPSASELKNALPSYDLICAYFAGQRAQSRQRLSERPPAPIAQPAKVPATGVKSSPAQLFPPKKENDVERKPRNILVNLFQSNDNEDKKGPILPNNTSLGTLPSSGAAGGVLAAGKVPTAHRAEKPLGAGTQPSNAQPPKSPRMHSVRDLPRASQLLPDPQRHHLTKSRVELPPQETKTAGPTLQPQQPPRSPRSFEVAPVMQRSVAKKTSSQKILQAVVPGFGTVNASPRINEQTQTLPGNIMTHCNVTVSSQRIPFKNERLNHANYGDSQRTISLFDKRKNHESNPSQVFDGPNVNAHYFPRSEGELLPRDPREGRTISRPPNIPFFFHRVNDSSVTLVNPNKPVQVFAQPFPVNSQSYLYKAHTQPLSMQPKEMTFSVRRQSDIQPAGKPPMQIFALK